MSLSAELTRRVRTVLGLGVRSDREILESSGLFDVNAYLIEGPDVHAAGVDPIDHFRADGWQEGRRPNLYFDPLWYADLYLSPAQPNITLPRDVDPLTHYVKQGEAAGCRPICYFDPAWYRETYRLSRRQSPLRHYLAHRRSQRFAPNGSFDLAFYMDRHGREIGVNRDPFAHFLTHAAARDLDPSATFHSAAYRARFMTPCEINSPTTKIVKGMAVREAAIPLLHALDASARAAAP